MKSNLLRLKPEMWQAARLFPKLILQSTVFKAATSNVAIREFKSDVINDSELSTILEAARLTQSAKNIQPWYFIVVRDRKTLDSLAELMAGDIDEDLTKRSPMVIAIVGDPRSEFWLLDLGRVVQTMTLVAWEMGIGSCVISGPEPPDREEYRTKAGRILGVPENLRMQELVAFGYPKNGKLPEHPKKIRKELSAILFQEKFGKYAMN
jgi:nitroreductase